MFGQYLRKRLDPKVLLTNAYMGRVVKEMDFKDIDDALHSTQLRRNLQTKVAGSLQAYEDEKQKAKAEEKNKTLLDDLTFISEDRKT